MKSSARSFTDTAGRIWPVTITLESGKRVHQLTGVNLFTLAQAEDDTPYGGLFKMLRDPLVFVDVLYAVCKPDAEKNNISEVEFAQALGGDSLQQAQHAIYEALADFSPSQDRDLMLALAQKDREIRTKATEMIAAKLRDIDADKLLTSNKSAGNSADSSE